MKATTEIVILIKIRTTMEIDLTSLCGIARNKAGEGAGKERERESERERERASEREIHDTYEKTMMPRTIA